MELIALIALIALILMFAEEATQETIVKQTTS
jgi:hypothetical protein